MARIQCPHCKAVNQDVGLDDPCWQCGTVLSAPMSAIDTGTGPATSEANPANKTGSSSAPIQRQLDKDQGSAPRPHTSQRQVRTLNTAAIVAILIALIVMVVFLYLKLKH